MKTKPKKFTHYIILDATKSERPGYLLTLYRREDGEHETLFYKTKIEIEKDIPFYMGLEIETF